MSELKYESYPCCMTCDCGPHLDYESRIAELEGALRKIVASLTVPEDVLNNAAQESVEGQLAVIAFTAIKQLAEDSLFKETK